MTAPTLFDELATVPDPRRRHGQRHPLSAILGRAALAMLMARKSLAGIARFGRQYGPSLAFALGFTCGKTPSLSTLSRTLAALDADAVETALARWVAARIDPADAEHLSLDGKTLRGSLDGDVPLAGAGVTADAMFTHADVGEEILERQGDYVVYAKDNPTQLRADIEAAFAAAEGGDFPPRCSPRGWRTRRRPRRGVRGTGGSSGGRGRRRRG